MATVPATFTQVSERFAYHQVCPDVVSKAPVQKLNVSFDNGYQVCFSF